MMLPTDARSPARGRRLAPAALRLLAAGLVVALTAACDSDAPPTGPDLHTATDHALEGENGVSDAAPGSVQLDPDAIDLRVGETADISGTVVNAAGQAVPNQPLAFSTADEAVASVNPTAPASATVTAEGAGETTVMGTRNAMSGTALVTVRKWGTSMTTTDASTTTAEDVTLSATLLREDDLPVAGAAVTLTLSGAEVAELLTDVDGVVSAVVSAGTVGLGEHTFTFAYAGSHANEASSADGTLEVQKGSTTLSIEDVSFSGTWGSLAEVDIVLTDASTGDPIADAAVGLASDFGDAEATTGSDGAATLSVEVFADLGDHAFTVSFAESSTHLGSSAESTVTVTQVPVVVGSVETEEQPWGTDGAVRIRLTTPGGDPAAGVKVRIDHRADGNLMPQVEAWSDGDGWIELPGFDLMPKTYLWRIESVVTLDGPTEFARGSGQIPEENEERSLVVLRRELRVVSVQILADGFTANRTVRWTVLDPVSSTPEGGIKVDVTVVQDGKTLASGAATSNQFGLAETTLSFKEGGTVTLNFELAGGTSAVLWWTLPPTSVSRSVPACAIC